MKYVFNPIRPLAQLETQHGRLCAGDVAELSDVEVQRAQNEFGDCLIPVVAETDDELFLELYDGETPSTDDEGDSE